MLVAQRPKQSSSTGLIQPMGHMFDTTTPQGKLFSKFTYEKAMEESARSFTKVHVYHLVMEGNQVCQA